MKSLLLILAIFGLTGGKPPFVQSVDLIELNHKYAKEGRHTFSQVIFYERVPATGKYRIRDWVLVETQESLNRIPVLRNGVWETCFVRDDITYHVKSKLFRESFTMTDPENDDAATWPKHLRRLLKRPGEKIPDE